MLILLSSSGSSSLYTTGPIRSRILNGPMYRGLSFPRLPNQKISLREKLQISLDIYFGNEPDDKLDLKPYEGCILYIREVVVVAIVGVVIVVAVIGVVVVVVVGGVSFIIKLSFMVIGFFCASRSVETLGATSFSIVAKNKKYRGLNSSEGGNIGDGVKIAGGVIGSGGGIGDSLA
ncbi:hypothetical protein Tco_0215934 [Tanacetum coccineum]